MWYVDKLFDQKQVESLSAKGFLVRSSGGVVRIEKYDCGAELRKSSGGRYHMTIMPSIMAQGQFARLWDAGYQKFLLTNEGQRFRFAWPSSETCAASMRSYAPRSACRPTTTKPSARPANTPCTTA